MKSHATPTLTSSPSWNRYATALGGLAAVGASVPSAQAGINILYTDFPDLTMDVVTQNIQFDLDHSGAAPYATLNPSSTPLTKDFVLAWSGAATENVGALPALNKAIAGYYILKLSAGATIDSTLPWISGPTYFEFYDVGNWQGGGEGYVGLRIQTGANFNYGWARVNYNDPANQMTLKDFAIERTLNTPILAGDTTSVPEPSSALLLALGAGGMALRRRREALAA